MTSKRIFIAVITYSQIIWVTQGQHQECTTDGFMATMKSLSSYLIRTKYYHILDVLLCVCSGIEHSSRIYGITSVISVLFLYYLRIIFITEGQHQECYTDGLVSMDPLVNMWLPVANLYYHLSFCVL